MLSPIPPFGMEPVSKTVTVRKITNGTIREESSCGPQGYVRTETFLDTKPTAGSESLAEAFDQLKGY